MSGLLAARMLHQHSPVVLERSDSLPHNHSAVLRFATSRVADTLGIPFKRVQLSKVVVPWRNPVADALQYSVKVLGQYRTDRSVLLPERWESSERWIAPPDLIERMAEGVDVRFGVTYDFPAEVPKVISTVPMPVLARAMGHPSLGWQWVGGTSITATLKNCEAYCSVMVPDPYLPFYRASITGDQLTVEMSDATVVEREVTEEQIIEWATELLGYSGSVSRVAVRSQEYAKIQPIDEASRKNFIYWASTIKGRAFQLGRYATWRPRLLLDDVVSDVRKIEGWMMSGSPEYDQEQHQDRRASGAHW